MNQREDVEGKIKRSEEQTEKAQKIQKAYQEYIIIGDDNTFAELMKLQDSYCILWIRKKLRNTGCYTDDNEESILQEARGAMWELISKDKEEKLIRESFAYYAFGIYKNKTMDIVRKVSKQRARLEIHSFEEPVGYSGATLEGALPPIIPPDMCEFEEIRKMYTMLFHIYCKAFTSSSAFPPKSLALYYARVLPHLLSVIPDTKGASAKWAYEKMGNRTIGELGVDSEKTLRCRVSADLRWCNEFICQINGKTDINGETTYLKDAVYTSVFSKGKIEDWADYMHKATRAAAADMVQKESELLSLVREYISEKDVLYCFAKEDETR